MKTTNLIIANNIKRTLGIVLTGCIAILIVTIIGGKLTGVDLENVYPADIPYTMWSFCIISVAIISAFVTMWYLNSPKLIPSINNGFIFGMLFVIVGFIGDIIALVPHKNGLDILLSYYAQPIYWATLVLVIIICSLVGYFKYNSIPQKNHKDR